MSHAYQIYIMGKTMIRFENHYLVYTVKLKLHTNDNDNEIPFDNYKILYGAKISQNNIHQNSV